MSPSEYQLLAMRTECDQEKSLARIQFCHPPPSGTFHTLNAVRMLHAVVGLAGEAGELAGAVERWLYYGQPLDETNVKEEIGDAFWYLAQACNVLELDMGEVMEANIAKLRARYPEKYNDDRAAEKGRDRVAEREVLEQTGHGFAEPPETTDA
jgi:NTP pyrophosphatase (non-canonical NTP hydrolase)